MIFTKEKSIFFEKNLFRGERSKWAKIDFGMNIAKSKSGTFFLAPKNIFKQNILGVNFEIFQIFRFFWPSTSKNGR